MNIVRLTDWNISELEDGSQRIVGCTEKEGKFLMTSRIKNQLTPSSYETQSGNIYVLVGEPLVRHV